VDICNGFINGIIWTFDLYIPSEEKD
jgi:hypothetical protein